MDATRTTRTVTFQSHNQSHILHSVSLAVSTLVVTVKEWYGHQQAHLNTTKNILLNREWL